MPEWEDYFQQGLEDYESGFDPENDDRDGYEVCMEQQEYAANYADACIEDEDDYEDDYEDDNEDDYQFNPYEEDWEVEDMPGESADERAEAYDNWNWDAGDA